MISMEVWWAVPPGWTSKEFLLLQHSSAYAFAQQLGDTGVMLQRWVWHRLLAALAAPKNPAISGVFCLVMRCFTHGRSTIWRISREQCLLFREPPWENPIYNANNMQICIRPNPKYPLLRYLVDETPSAQRNCPCFTMRISPSLTLLYGGIPNAIFFRRFSHYIAPMNHRPWKRWYQIVNRGN